MKQAGCSSDEATVSLLKKKVLFQGSVASSKSLTRGNK